MVLLSFGLHGWLVLLAALAIGVITTVAIARVLFFLPAAATALVVWLISESKMPGASLSSPSLSSQSCNVEYHASL